MLNGTSYVKRYTYLDDKLYVIDEFDIALIFRYTFHIPSSDYV